MNKMIKVLNLDLDKKPYIMNIWEELVEQDGISIKPIKECLN